MTFNDPSFESELKELIARGEKSQAIKLYRERTGVGLKEAKEAVEALERGEAPQTRPSTASYSDGEIVSLLKQGEKIQAIKLYRDRTGAGLKEAKDAVEALARDRGITPPSRGGCMGAVLLAATVGAGALVAVLACRGI